MNGQYSMRSQELPNYKGYMFDQMGYLFPVYILPEKNKREEENLLLMGWHSTKCVNI